MHIGIKIQAICEAERIGCLPAHERLIVKAVEEEGEIGDFSAIVEAPRVVDGFVAFDSYIFLGYYLSHFFKHDISKEILRKIS